MKGKTSVKMMSLNGVCCLLPRAGQELSQAPRFAALAEGRTRRSQRTVTDCATLLDSDSDAPLFVRDSQWTMVGCIGRGFDAAGDPPE